MDHSGRTSLRNGIVWSLTALCFLALAGLCLNLIIARAYSPEVLGLFNIVFAVYVVASHLSVLGLQNAALQAVSVAPDDAPDVLRAAFVSVLCVNLALLPVFVLLPGALERIFPQVPQLGQAWALVVPGLAVFALNKVALAGINGLRRMRAHALFLSLRFALIIGLLLVCVLMQAPGWMLAAVLAGAEGLLAPALALYLWRSRLLSIKGRKSSTLGTQMRALLRFGVLSAPSGALASLNGRVDVLMIGALLGAQSVGVYTIAVLVYDSGVQIAVAVRNNVNPLIARGATTGPPDAILSLTRKIALALGAAFGVAAVLAYGAYPGLSAAVLRDPVYAGALAPMIILLLALALAGGGICFNMTLSQSGHPGLQSLLVLIAICLNIAANALLMPAYGLVGAALGTGIALLGAAMVNVVLVRHFVGLRLFI